MVERVCRTVDGLKPSHVCVIVGHGGERVAEAVKARWPKAKFFTQKVLNGSGGAVKQALSWLKSQKGDVVVTCGDAPLLQTQSLANLRKLHHKEGNAATVLSADVEKPFGYGRIVREEDGSLEKIVEELDATQAERQIHEINTGTYCFNVAALVRALPRITSKNAKNEFYLTDVIEILKGDGARVGAVVCDDPNEALGINNRFDLARAEAALKARTLASLMAAGVTIIDPASTYVSEMAHVGTDTVLWPQTYLLGNTRIGSNCQIGPWAHITDCVIENNVTFKASFAESSVIRREAKVGPYSRVRPKSDVGPRVHLGNFSEVKATVLGEGSKVNHLSYLGDAKVGKNVNIGAGTITCNYDGIQKFPTIIQDHAFIGSNVNLIAPVQLGAHSVIGAGSSISQDVPAWALAVERTGVVVKKEWAKKKFKNKK